MDNYFIKQLRADEVRHMRGPLEKVNEIGEIRWPFVPDFFIAHWSSMIGEGNATMFVAMTREDQQVVGALGAMLTPFLRNGQTNAVAHFWHVLPDHRGHGIGRRFLEKFQDWAEAQGADRCFAGHTIKDDPVDDENPDKVQQLLDEAGYTKVEVSYEKVI